MTDCSSMALERAAMLVGLRQRFDILRRRAPHEERLLRFQRPYRTRCGRSRSSGELLEHLADPGRGRVAADDPHSTDVALVIDEIDDAEVREIPRGDLGDPRQRLVVVERVVASSRPDFRKESLLVFDSFLLGDVAERDGENPCAADLQLRDGGIGWELLTVLATADDDRAALPILLAASYLRRIAARADGGRREPLGMRMSSGAPITSDFE